MGSRRENTFNTFEHSIFKNHLVQQTERIKLNSSITYHAQDSLSFDEKPITHDAVKKGRADEGSTGGNVNAISP